MGGGAPKHNKQLQAHSITLTSLVNVYDAPQNDHANNMQTSWEHESHMNFFL
jgi:hypothetical protein